jgi:hypothetical protein
MKSFSCSETALRQATSANVSRNKGAPRGNSGDLDLKPINLPSGRGSPAERSTNSVASTVSALALVQIVHV